MVSDRHSGGNWSFRDRFSVQEAIQVTELGEKRHWMVEKQLRRRGIRDERVLRTMEVIPRELFVPEDYAIDAYEDTPIGIGFEQTISQPYMTALMCEVLALNGNERVLDVGTGSGYHAAVLSQLAGEVFSIELIPELAETARRNLSRAGLLDRVHVLTGDGSKGYPPAALYDAISVAAGAPETPPALLDQLNDPGRLVIPVGSMGDQDLEVITKYQGQISKRVATLCRFVPLRGEQGWKN
jgi:protein-L-isoaspartate(D-aspartate) O-methyltransferase